MLQCSKVGVMNYTTPACSDQWKKKSSVVFSRCFCGLTEFLQESYCQLTLIHVYMYVYSISSWKKEILNVISFGCDVNIYHCQCRIFIEQFLVWFSTSKYCFGPMLVQCNTWYFHLRCHSLLHLECLELQTAPCTAPN